LHATKLGILDMTWNTLCPGCGYVLETTTAHSMRDEYHCALCVSAYEPSLDEMVDVSFIVNRSFRKIAAHEPEKMPPLEFMRQLVMSPGLKLPEGDEWSSFLERTMLDVESLAPRELAHASVELPTDWVAVFEPVTHSCSFIVPTGERSHERRELSFLFDSGGCTPAKVEVAPGPIRVRLTNATTHRLFPGLWIVGERFHDLLHQRRRMFSARDLFTQQTFRDLWGASALDVDQRLKITSLTVLFTDLKGSTQLYGRVGDLAAYDLVRSHFRVLTDVVRGTGGAVVKTIGDAVMATFPTVESGMVAALSMRQAMSELNSQRDADDLIVKIGLHAGPCLAVTLNERLDYFGQTVNIAARVQGLATDRSIFVTEPVLRADGVEALLEQRNIEPVPQRTKLRGIDDELVVFEIP
jgi:class 3 adenylate cyclase